MRLFRALTSIEQLAAHLRLEIQSGSLGATLPGVHRLAGQLGVSPRTVVAAVGQLEREGILASQGPRRRCRIVRQPERPASGLRVVVLQYEAADRLVPYVLDLVHRLENAGHVPVFARETLLDLHRDPKRVVALVSQQEADADGRDEIHPRRRTDPDRGGHDRRGSDRLGER